MSALLARLNKTAAHLEKVRSAAETTVCEAAHAYLKAEVLAYSKAHPRRKVTFCSAMGAVTLHVQKGGAAGRREGDVYSEYSYGGHYGDKHPPAFLGELERLADSTDLGYGLTGPLLLECRGGAVIRELTDW